MVGAGVPTGSNTPYPGGCGALAHARLDHSQGTRVRPARCRTAAGACRAPISIRSTCQRWRPNRCWAPTHAGRSAKQIQPRHSSHRQPGKPSPLSTCSLAGRLRDDWSVPRPEDRRDRIHDLFQQPGIE